MKPQRRICWPPDEVCLEGGCLFCNDSPYRYVSAIEDYAIEHGMLEAFDYGKRHGWNNAEIRETQ